MNRTPWTDAARSPGAIQEASIAGPDVRSRYYLRWRWRCWFYLGPLVAQEAAESTQQLDDDTTLLDGTP